MKLHHHTLRYMSVSLLLIISIWAGIFYVSMLDEIYDSIDDGLDNYKVLIIEKAQRDTSVLTRTVFGESNYSITPLPEHKALHEHERYKDTLMYMVNEEDNEPVRMLTTVFRAHDRYYRLQVVSSMVEEDDLMKDLFYALIWLYIAIVGSMILINHFLLKKIWRPFYNLISRLGDFRLHSETVFEAPATNVKEFKALNEAIAALLDENLKTYNSQKQFIENAAHELQTPLAISINRLELMAEQSQDDQQLQAYAAVIQQLERMTRLNKSLLLISRIENRQFITEDTVEFNTLLQDELQHFAELADYKQITVSCESRGLFQWRCNPELALILAGNLIKNAIVHNTANGTIQVIITTAGFTVCNTGREQALDTRNIFSRFYKSSDDAGSTGLGLAIVSTIAALYRLKVTYRYDNGRHYFQVSH